MRAAFFGLLILIQSISASSTQPQTTTAGEVLAADAPRTTVEGNKFIAPAGWRIEVRGRATILSPPEGNSHIALVDVHAKDADSAVAAAWAAYRPDAKWPLKVTNSFPNKDGWSDIRGYTYQTSPNEKRDVSANARRAADTWTVVLYDMDQAVGEKRGGQVALIFSRLLPKGYERETFAGKTAHKLDAKRIAELSRFVESGRQKLGVPGVSIGVIQDGKVVFEGGFGVREIGNAAKPDAETLYIVASNTKALTTLMLAKLLDEGKLTWETPATSLLPSFKLGDPDTTSRVLVKHLICACTGLPRQDYEWLFQYQGVTPEAALKTLATIQPTSKFGEMFQDLELARRCRRFSRRPRGVPDPRAWRRVRRGDGDPGVSSPRHDGDDVRLQAGARRQSRLGHAPDVDGRPAPAAMDVNYSVIPVRPAGGAWSNVRDMLKYVQMELDEGTLPNGTRYVAKDTLLARRAPQVSIGQDATYGMGLMVDRTYGTPVVRHGGDLIGYHSDMIWLPEHKVGAVILTNGDPGWVLRGLLDRKLLELLFDGRPEADADVAAQAKSFFEQLAADRKLLTVPAAAVDSGKLATRYANDALGEIVVRRAGAATIFDFGEWKSEVATRHNPDGTVSFVTVAPGIIGLEFVVGPGPKPALIGRDAQHEYVFAADTSAPAK